MHCTTDALLCLGSSICEVLASNEHHVTTFFDTEKTYGAVWRHGIVISLFDFGLRGRLPVFIQQFLSQLSIRTRIMGVLSEARPLEGVP